MVGHVPSACTVVVGMKEVDLISIFCFLSFHNTCFNGAKYFEAVCYFSVVLTGTRDKMPQIAKTIQDFLM